VQQLATYMQRMSSSLTTCLQGQEELLTRLAAKVESMEGRLSHLGQNSTLRPPPRPPKQPPSGSPTGSSPEAVRAAPTGAAATAATSHGARSTPALTPGGGKKYSRFSVSSLLPDPTAGGIRPACVNELVLTVPFEFGSVFLGHNVVSISAFFNYFKDSTAVLVAAGRVNFGWAPPPWGQVGPAPVPASLQPLVDLGVPMDDLNLFVNYLFNLDKTSLPRLLIGGSLRLMVEASAATLIMYYGECMANSEFPRVQVCLQQAYSHVFQCNSSSSSSSSVGGSASIALPTPDAALVHWGSVIHLEFDRANLPVVTP